MRTELRDGEALILEVKRHWIVLLRQAFLAIFSLLIFASTFIYPRVSQLGGLALAFAVGAFLYFLYGFYDRETDIWAVTNLRVIDEWGVFTRNTRESPIESINNVSYEQPFTGLMLGYGDVKIQTAAEHGETLIRFVMHPKELKETILKAQEDYRRSPARQDDENPQEGTVECPLCAERIKAKATVCRFCHRDILAADVSTAQSENKFKKPGGST